MYNADLKNTSALNKSSQCPSASVAVETRDTPLDQLDMGTSLMTDTHEERPTRLILTPRTRDSNRHKDEKSKKQI